MIDVAVSTETMDTIITLGWTFFQPYYTMSSVAIKQISVCESGNLSCLQNVLNVCFNSLIDLDDRSRIVIGCLNE